MGCSLDVSAPHREVSALHLKVSAPRLEVSAPRLEVSALQLEVSALQLEVSGGTPAGLPAPHLEAGGLLEVCVVVPPHFR
jgi:hypothetical protein